MKVVIRVFTKYISQRGCTTLFFFDTKKDILPMHLEGEGQSLFFLFEVEGFLLCPRDPPSPSQFRPLVSVPSRSWTKGGTSYNSNSNLVDKGEDGSKHLCH